MIPYVSTNFIFAEILHVYYVKYALEILHQAKFI